MVQIAQAVLSLLSFTAQWSQRPLQATDTTSVEVASPEARPNITKSIAIVGAGSGGLAILKGLLDLPQDVRSTWEIVLYEQRRDVGGVWYADPQPPQPPTLPETPLYPLLHTNTPHPTMTYPGFTFPPGTPLFPSHEYVWQYHVDYAEHFNLTRHINVNHTVLAAGWKGSSARGKWIVDVTRTDRPEEVQQRSFDHLIVANGHNHYPRIPHWAGEDDWLGNTPLGKPKREILHSIFYREPEGYINRTVVIVGGGASGRDAALQVGAVTKTYQSLREGSVPPDGAQVIVKPPISHFTIDAVVFEDGSSLSDVDSVILATGYEFLVPFLSRIPKDSGITTPALVTSPATTANSTSAAALTTNLRYIFPLYEHIFSLSPAFPPTALAFVGLPVLIANCPSDRAQALFISHAIADPSVLPPRGEMLDGLVAREANVRARGYDPYYVGHKMVGGDDEAQAYQNALVRFLKRAGRLPDDGREYVEPWRVMARKESRLLARAWSRVEEHGDQARWLDGITTEEQWASVMWRLVDWQAEWEKEHGQGPDTYA
ncbi:NAD(P)/FAD-dependent oxidoreductase [Phanerochaete sordida]|uniref:NAD(P)/FAD-dependent oxidoreductase n=1 Tax=Phanerochaete sordida TaxID=48140 RepID=A0A9P3GND2_9APHY|nr:NAD(P)/FAD-dependent oxidoreductase [Phanerochaete sordida]